MRVAALVSFFTALSAVSAFPKHPDPTDCTCVEVVTSTTTNIDRTKTSKTTIYSTSTLDPKTKTAKIVTTATSDYTATASVDVPFTSTNTIIETAAPGVDSFFGKNNKACVCPTTSTSTKLKTAHGTTTVVKTVTDVAKTQPPAVTVTNVKTKNAKSAVTTNTAYHTIYYKSNVTSTVPYSMSNSSTTAGPTGTGSDIVMLTTSTAPYPMGNSSTTAGPTGTGTGMVMLTTGI